MREQTRPPVLRLYEGEIAVDSFAGGGGASTAISQAIGRSPDIAINHDPEAIAMHAANHPETEHHCQDVWEVDPVEACRGRAVGLAWFSPDCKHFSKAKGGKPVEKKIRSLAWVVVRWAKTVAPRVIFLENVEEFQDWGPLVGDRPDPMRRGFTFRRWCAMLRSLGYVVDSRELRACDYGAPTTRKRLFVVARRDGEPIRWPRPTHGPGLARYRTAAECIDWSIPCRSIFERPRPLAENTQRRIARGLRKYVLEAAEPFIVPVAHAGDARAHSAREPLRTVTGAHRGELALVTPMVMPATHGASRGRPDSRIYSADEPVRTITTLGAQAYLVAPTLIQTSYGERPGQKPRALDLHAPLGTVVAGGGKHALVAAFLAKHYGGHETPGSALSKSIDTVTTQDHHALVSAYLLKMRGGPADHQVTAQDLREPLPTVTAGGNHLFEVRAFLLKYFGTDQDPRLDEPLHTITTRHRFGLVTVLGVDYVIVDICMRMLEPRELYLAQGVPASYIIDMAGGRRLSKTAQIRMCGNMVSPPPARALIEANLPEAAALEAPAEGVLS